MKVDPKKNIILLYPPLPIGTYHKNLVIWGEKFFETFG
jgi:hypothetical protein